MGRNRGVTPAVLQLEPAHLAEVVHGFLGSAVGKRKEAPSVNGPIEP